MVQQQSIDQTIMREREQAGKVEREKLQEELKKMTNLIQQNEILTVGVFHPANEREAAVRHRGEEPKASGLRAERGHSRRRQGRHERDSEAH